MLFMFQSVSKSRRQPVKWSRTGDVRVKIAVENKTPALAVVDWLLNRGQERVCAGALPVVCLVHAWRN
jgi:hypothetical protein